MQNTEHHKRQQQGPERRHLGVEKAPQKATKRRPTGPSKSSSVWASLEALFGAFWGSFRASWGAVSASGAAGGSFWGSRRPFLGLPGGGGKRAKKAAENLPKMLKTARNSSKTCFLSLFGPLGRPQNSSHSMISGGEKRYFLAFGCDFDGKKCFEHCKTRGFAISGTAETLYFASENEVFLTI
jgi:hypothetical protein